VHYKSKPNAKTPRKTHKKSTNVKSLTKIVCFEQFSELGRISHGEDVVGQSVRGAWQDPHVRTPAGQMFFLTPNQQRQSTEGTK